MTDRVLGNSVGSSENTRKEEAFLSYINPFIISVVRTFALSNGFGAENEHRIEDMQQEARLALLQAFRERGRRMPKTQTDYYYQIRAACRATVARDRNITVPPSWIKPCSNKARESEALVTLSFNELSGAIVDAAPPVDEQVISRVLIHDMLAMMRPKERRVLMLLADGFTPTEINRMTGVHRYSMQLYLEKARKIIVGDRQSKAA